MVVLVEDETLRTRAKTTSATSARTIRVFLFLSLAGCYRARTPLSQGGREKSANQLSGPGQRRRAALKDGAHSRRLAGGARGVARLIDCMRSGRVGGAIWCAAFALFSVTDERLVVGPERAVSSNTDLVPATQGGRRSGFDHPTSARVLSVPSSQLALSLTFMGPDRTSLRHDANADAGRRPLALSAEFGALAGPPHFYLPGLTTRVHAFALGTPPSTSVPARCQ
jgi:hypothetical protein